VVVVVVTVGMAQQALVVLAEQQVSMLGLMLETAALVKQLKLLAVAVAQLLRVLMVITLLQMLQEQLVAEAGTKEVLEAGVLQDTVKAAPTLLVSFGLVEEVEEVILAVPEVGVLVLETVVEADLRI
jgi:hypothetical protein